MGPWFTVAAILEHDLPFGPRLNKVPTAGVEPCVIRQLVKKHIIASYSWWRNPPPPMAVAVLLGEPLPRVQVPALVLVVAKLRFRLHRLRHHFDRASIRVFRVIDN